MAEWLGQLLAWVPAWLSVPLLIIIIVITILIWFGWEITFADDAIPALRRRKHDKK